MPSPIRFFRRIARRDDGRLRDEGAQKGESLPMDVFSESQTPAAYFTRSPNRWVKIRLARSHDNFDPNANACARETIREPAAEMLGTMILMLVGNGVNCQFALSGDVNVSPSPKGSYLGFNMTWGCGLYGRMPFFSF
jgi:hypothetical protein